MEGPGLRRRIVLWVLAFVLMGSAAVYQRLTGPTHPRRGQFEIGGQSYPHRLVRSAVVTGDARVSVPAPAPDATGVLYCKRYPTKDTYSKLPLHVEGEELAGYLPAQPAAGKLEYFLVIESGGDTARAPSDVEETVIIRFKGEVPLGALIPHVVVMFFAILIGLRAGLSAFFLPGETRVLSYITLGGLTLGGMFLGPVVQKYAFGAFWTGFPFGYDLTDNKTLIMWLVWVAACIPLLVTRRGGPGLARVGVVLAAIIMIGVFLIPHSMRGSELDYEKLDRGTAPVDAIGTG